MCTGSFFPHILSGTDEQGGYFHIVSDTDKQGGYFHIVSDTDKQGGYFHIVSDTRVHRGVIFTQLTSRQETDKIAPLT